MFCEAVGEPDYRVIRVGALDDRDNLGPNIVYGQRLRLRGLYLAMMPKSLSGSLRVCSFSVIEDWVSAWAVVDVSADRGSRLRSVWYRTEGQHSPK